MTTTDGRGPREDGGGRPSPRPPGPDADGGLARVAEFTGGNPGIERSLQSFYENEDTLPTGEQIDRELFEFVGRAMQAGNDSQRTDRSR